VRPGYTYTTPGPHKRSMMNTFDNTIIYPLDMEKLAASVGMDVKHSVEFNGEYGLLINPIDNTVGLMHKEAILYIETPFALDVYKKIEGAVSLMPSWSAKLTVDEAKEYTKDAVTIAKFMGERRGYNRRLQNNERGVTDWLNGQ
jgi:hypothetical protein